MYGAKKKAVIDGGGGGGGYVSREKPYIRPRPDIGRQDDRDLIEIIEMLAEAGVLN